MNRRRHHLSGGGGGGQQHRPLTTFTAIATTTTTTICYSLRRSITSTSPISWLWLRCDHGYGHDDNNINTQHTNTTSMEQGNSARCRYRWCTYVVAVSFKRMLWEWVNINAMGVMMIRHGGKVGCDSNEDYDTNNYCGGGGRKEDRLEAVCSGSSASSTVAPFTTARSSSSWHYSRG